LFCCRFLSLAVDCVCKFDNSSSGQYVGSASLAVVPSAAALADLESSLRRSDVRQETGDTGDAEIQGPRQMGRYLSDGSRI